MATNAPDNLILSDFRPTPKVVLPTTPITVPKTPVIEGHTHLGETFGGGWCNRPVEELLAVMDAAHVQVLADMDGGWGEGILNQRLNTFKAVAPERFCFFGGVDFEQWPEHSDRFGEWAAKQFRAQAKRGAQGLKVWKGLGLWIKDQHGQLVPVDDARLDPVWATAGELGLPVLIHTADPVAFFDPVDATNERWEELHAHPDWQFPSPPYPPFIRLMQQLKNMVKNHPQTTFIGAHVGGYAENLGWVAAMLDECPNFYVDIAARIGELGRQPYTARRFFINYADRIIFGTDHPPSVEAFQLYYRFLETDDEYFNYGLGESPTQGRWQINGLYLPDDVLAKVYYQNALQVFSGITI